MTMDRERARAGLWPAERPKLVGEEVQEARAHVEACPDCRDFFAQDRALLEVFERIRTESAPREVRERVFDALARTRAESSRLAPRAGLRGRRRMWSLLGGVGALAAASGAALMIAVADRPIGPDARPSEGAVFVEDYLRRAVGQDHIVTSDPDEVARFLTRELGLSLRPMRVAGLELERAEICLLEGQRGALVVYKLNGAVISHYLIPRAGTEVRAPALSARPEGAVGVELPVVTWSTPLLEQALVGDVSADRLLRLARGVSAES